MANEYVLDGYNIIHKHRDLEKIMDSGPEGPERSRQKLLHLLAVRFADKKVRVSVIFDGRYPGLSTQSRFPGINAKYSLAPQTADEVIMSYVENARKPRGITVVTSDRQIINTLDKSGCRFILSEEFVRRFLSADRTEDPDRDEAIRHRKLDEHQVREWMEYFGLKDDPEIE